MWKALKPPSLVITRLLNRSFKTTNFLCPPFHQYETEWAPPSPTASSASRVAGWKQGWWACAGLSDLGPSAQEANQGQVPDRVSCLCSLYIDALIFFSFPCVQWHVLQRGTCRHSAIVCWWLKTSLLVVHRGKDPTVVYISTYHCLWLCKIGMNI